MRLRALLAIVALVSLPALAQQTVTKAGTAAPYAQGVQGVAGGVPLPTTITNSISVSGAADTVGLNATFSSNAVCATVLLTGQPGAGFALQAGTLAATLTPSVSEDATPATPGCTGGNYVPSKFIVDVNGNTSTTLVVTNPNVYTHYGIATLAGSRCAKVCTTSFTSGSAVGNIVAGVALSPSPAPSADVTDRAGRLLGKVYGSDGNQLATANTGRLQVDVISGGGSNASVSAIGAAPPASAAYGGFFDGTNLQGARVYDTDSGAGTQFTLGALLRKSASGGSVDFGTATDPIRVDPTGTTVQPISATSLPLPTGASTETTLALIKTDVDKIPASPATDRTTAAAPFSTRLSDGAAFYDATKTGQLPAALDGSGFLKTHEQGTAAISAAALPLPTGAAADATLTGGTAKSIVRGGAKGATTAADVTSTANGADHQGLDVAVQGTVTVAGTVTTTPPANASTNVTQFGSTNISTGTGAGGAGIPRVTVSNDSTVGLVAGAAIVGKVGIDQTTPGTTNLVSAGQSGAWTVGQSGSWTVDISDRAARLLGVIYGSQAQQLKQTATNFNLQSELAVGGTLIDPRSIRLLTSGDVVDVSDRLARVLGHVICDSGCTPGGSFSDNTAFTAGSTAISVDGGEFNDTPLADVTSGNAASVRITKQRAFHVNLRDSSGNEVTSLGSSGQITDGVYGAAKATVLPQGQRADNTGVPLVVTLAPSSNPLPMTLTLQGQPTTTKGAAPTYNILSKVQLIDEHGHMANVKGPAQPPTVNDPAQVVAVSPTPAPVCPFVAALSQTANTIVVPGLASKTTYICKVFVVSTTAQSVSLTEGTGTTCGTLGAALAGSTTVANGMPLAANGGWVEGNGAGIVYTAKKIGDDVCLLQSGAGLVAGSVSYTYF